ncbi:hypothetical protein [Amycolatopsis sp. NPDC004169]|uniref:hypothetical protein n=1 Tax=Amycolatopsis sp. NPDC004169 TaxID=3154453 RepID=UPI0033A4CF8A
MAAVLTAASILVCPHRFPFKVAPSQELLAVDGEFVLLRSDLLKVKIETCANNPKCTNITEVTAGLSTTLAIGGDQVVLDTAAGTTNAAPGWQVQLAAQDKLEAK